MKKDQIFYVGQKAFIDKNGEILVLIPPHGGVDFPGGKIREGEHDFDESLKREVYEETGLTIDILKPFHRWYFTFQQSHPHAGQKVFLVGIKCRYISGEIKISNEHRAFKWVNKDNYKELDDNSDHFKALEKYFEAM